MLKQTVKYKDFNDVDQEETLYFNLTRTEMMDLLGLQDRLRSWLDRVQGPQRDLSTTEILDMVDVIKLLIEKAYGERSEDGKQFRKSPDIFENFKQSAAYDAFVFGLFEQPEQAVGFMIGILPQSLVENSPELAEARKMVQGTPVTETVSLDATEKEVPAWIREDRDPTRAEIDRMSQDELRLAFQRKSGQQPA